MNSRKYWKDREEEALKHYITEEEEYDTEIERIYRDMLDGVQAEIDGFYGRYAKAEGISLAEAKKRVSKLDIAAYERKAARYVKAAAADRASTGKTNKNGAYFSKRANEEMRLYNATMKINRLEMLKANIGLELIKGHDELDKFMGDILQGRTMAELERQAGILGKTIRNNAKLAHTIPNASFHNATFSDRIWQNQDQMRDDLSKLLQTGMIQGKNARALAGDLRKYWYGADPKTGGGVVYCTERLMRTELARVQTEAQKQSFERNGFDKYIFIRNTGCCHLCTEAANADTGYSEKGVYLVEKMMPGLNAAPLHPNCRCSVAAWEDNEEYEAWLDYLEKGGTTAEWNKLKARASTERMYRTYDDPMREKMGSAFESHPKETAEFIETLKQKGIGLSFRDDAMGYQPNPTPGKGGQVIMEEEASYSAWLHEMQHVYDDEASGWRGFRNFTDPYTAYKFEENAYNVEIDFARKHGYTDLVERLELLKQKRRKELLPNEAD